jgi:collagen type VI alpha
MIDLVFIMDGSGSVGTAGFEMQKAFVNAFVAKMNLGTTTGQVGVVMFSGTSNILTGLSSTAADITAKVTAVQWPQLTTNLAGAFKDAQAVLQEGRPDALSVVFVLTDGDVASRKDALEAAHDIRKSARVMIAPLGPAAPRQFVAQLASLPPRANVLPVHEYLTTLSGAAEIKRMVTNVCPKIA